MQGSLNIKVVRKHYVVLMLLLGKEREAPVVKRQMEVG